LKVSGVLVSSFQIERGVRSSNPNPSLMKYKIAYQYMIAGCIEVEASSLEEAKELAKDASANNQENEFYVDGSYEVNEEMTEEYNNPQN
jgi:hypothetical protein